MKRAWFTAASILVALGLTAAPHASAATPIHDQAWQTLSTYLTAATQDNAAKVAALSSDARFAPGTASAHYALMFQLPQAQIASFTIDSELPESATSSSFEVTVTNRDGSSMQVPVTLSDRTGAWLVEVNQESLGSHFRLLHGWAKSSTRATTALTPSLAPGEIATWDFQGLTSTLYSIDTFSPNDENFDHVTLHLQQDSVASYMTAEVQYAVVISLIFGDLEWGTPVVVYGNIWGTAKNYVLYGTSADPPDCQLRFVNYDSTETNPINGFGSAYEY